MATEESFRYRHAAPPTHDGHDDDEQQEDGGRTSLRLLLVGQEGGDCNRQKLSLSPLTLWFIPSHKMDLRIMMMITIGTPVMTTMIIMKTIICIDGNKQRFSAFPPLFLFHSQLFDQIPCDPQKNHLLVRWVRSVTPTSYWFYQIAQILQVWSPRWLKQWNILKIRTYSKTMDNSWTCACDLTSVCAKSAPGRPSSI